MNRTPEMVKLLEEFNGRCAICLKAAGDDEHYVISRICRTLGREAVNTMPTCGPCWSDWGGRRDPISLRNPNRSAVYGPFHRDDIVPGEVGALGFRHWRIEDCRLMDANELRDIKEA